MTAIASSHKDPTVEERAAEFAAAVREHLSDLPPEELDELLDGLQADLVERLGDGDGGGGSGDGSGDGSGGGGGGDLGDPGAYAEELRQAAGLPPREEAAQGRRRSLREALSATRAEAAERFRRFWDASPPRRAVRDFAVSLRPVWWVARGLVLAWVLLSLLGMAYLSLPATALVLALILLSVQWGRGAWAPARWLVWLRRAANAAAILLLLPAVSVVLNQVAAPRYIEAGPSYQPGLTQNGAQIENIFAYDCAGRPLDGVQLFDQGGRPITTLLGELADGAQPAPGWDEAAQRNIFYLRSGLVTMPETWNVFPLREARLDPTDDWTRAEQRAEAADPPFAEIPSLGSGCPAPEAAAQGSAGSTAEPGDGGTP